MLETKDSNYLKFCIYSKGSQIQKPLQFLKKQIFKTEKKLGINNIFNENIFKNMDFIYTLESSCIHSVLCQKNYNTLDLKHIDYFHTYPHLNSINFQTIAQMGWLFADYFDKQLSINLAEEIINQSFLFFKNQEIQQMITLVRKDKNIDLFCQKYGGKIESHEPIFLNNTPCKWITLFKDNIVNSTPLDQTIFYPISASA